MFSPQSEKKCVDSPALAQRVVRYDLLLHSNTRKLWNLSIRSTLCMTPFNATINQVSWATFLPLFLDHHHHLYFSGREEIYPLVPASISPFYWVFNSKLLTSGFSNAGPHCAASRTLRKLTLEETFFLLKSCMLLFFVFCFVYRVSSLLFFFRTYFVNDRNQIANE